MFRDKLLELMVFYSTVQESRRIINWNYSHRSYSSARERRHHRTSWNC